MKVVKFYTLDTETKRLDCTVWYLQNNLKVSQIIWQVEAFVRQNHLTCYMDAIMVYPSVKVFESETKKNLTVQKSHIQYLNIG